MFKELAESQEQLKELGYTIEAEAVQLYRAAEATQRLGQKMLHASESVFAYSSFNADEELYIITNAMETFSRLVAHFSAVAPGEDSDD